jgi:hypothetical protein
MTNRSRSYNLDLLHKVQGEYAKAEPLLRQAWEMRQRLYLTDKYPQGHTELAMSLHSLGSYRPLLLVFAYLVVIRRRKNWPANSRTPANAWRF